VTFRALDDDEIQRYCAGPEPYDKAGGYGIQGVAALFIERIDGSYTGVMGLPLFETGRMLTQAGMKLL
jgi:septum formation protein